MNLPPLTQRALARLLQVDPKDQRGDRGAGSESARSPGGDRMTDNQRGLLLRLIVESGVHGDQAAAEMCRAAGVQRPQDITKRQASHLIDNWQRQQRR